MKGLALVFALALAGGCGRTPPPVDLSGTWPSAPGDLDDVRDAYTRRAVLRGDFHQILEVYATFRAPPWYAAAAARAAAARGVPYEREADAAHALADGDYQFTLVVTTHDRDENDLDRGERSVWRLALVDAAGGETAPSSITRDRRPRAVRAAEQPGLGDFAEVYTVTFPRAAAALGPEVQSVTLRMWSPRGGVAMSWRAR